MSEEMTSFGSCPACGVPVPSSARYCPNCGARLRRPGDDDAQFGEAVEDRAVEPDNDEPIIVAPSELDTQPVGWTASPRDWGGEPPPPPGSARTERRNRTLWIILGIIGFIILCCCGLFFLMFAVSAADSSFQSEFSWVVNRVQT